MDYTDALAAGWRICPLHEIIMLPDGARACGCGKPECEAIGKHPRMANWQIGAKWDAEQLAYLEDEEGEFFGNQFLDGHGVVLQPSGLLVVDVDGRNGGWPSARKLAHIRAKCGYIIQTGSQNGEHWYFKAPAGIDLRQSHQDYPGIDFKSTGFVVGAYSLHASGNRYHALEGSAAQVTDAPQELIELLKIPEKKAVFSVHGTQTSVSPLEQMLAAIPNPGRDYELWIRVGMALHDATGGDGKGYALWDKWSAQSTAYDDALMPMKWHSFGKSARPVTAGTLHHIAEHYGYIEPVEFVDDTDWEEEEPAAPQQQTRTTPPAKRVNLLRPPGFVGEITQWVNSRCAYPREKLAVAAALQIVSNAAGLNYLVEGMKTSLNLVTLGIAGSRTGKGAIKACIDEVHYALGLAPASHGKFKSSQELLRNGIAHQPILYVYDEFGKQLEKLAGAGKSGAHYLEDLIAEMMAIYSVPTKTHGISGDMKRELREMAQKQVAMECKKLGIQDGEDPRKVAAADPHGALAAAFRAVDMANSGLVQPYLSFFGLSEPHSFHAALDKDGWLLTGGFIGRALIFEEEETVPKKKEIYSDEKAPMHIIGRLQELLTCGNAAIDSSGDKRIERVGDWRMIGWTEDAKSYLAKIHAYWHDAACRERDIGSGLESQALGAAELAIKVAGVLGVAHGQITLEHIEWAHALVQYVTQDKIERARTTDKLRSHAPAEKGDGLLGAILRHINKLDTFTTAGRVRQAVGRTKVTLEDVEKALDHLAAAGKVRVEVTTTKQNKTVTHYYKI